MRFRSARRISKVRRQVDEYGWRILTLFCRACHLAQAVRGGQAEGGRTAEKAGICSVLTRFIRALWRSRIRLLSWSQLLRIGLQPFMESNNTHYYRTIYGLNKHVLEAHIVPHKCRQNSVPPALQTWHLDPTDQPIESRCPMNTQSGLAGLDPTEKAPVAQGPPRCGAKN